MLPAVGKREVRWRRRKEAEVMQRCKDYNTQTTERLAD
jgi:hypothetical protein